MDNFKEIPSEWPDTNYEEYCRKLEHFNKVYMERELQQKQDLIDDQQIYEADDLEEQVRLIRKYQLKQIREDLVIDLSFLNDIPQIDLLNNGKVIKQVVQEGQFSKYKQVYPKEDSNVKIQMECRFMDGKLLDPYDSFGNETKYKLNQIIQKGIQETLMTMKNGEECYVTLDSEMHWGQNYKYFLQGGRYIIVGNNKLIFRLRLVDYQNIRPNFATGVFQFQELKDYIDENKDKGNELYKKGQFEQAHKIYKKVYQGISILNKKRVKKFTENEKQEYEQCVIQVGGNYAQCLINFEKYQGAEKVVKHIMGLASIGLVQQIKNLKRLGLIKMKLKYFDEAVKIYQRLMEIDPLQTQVYVESINTTRQKQKGYQKLMMQNYGNMDSNLRKIEIQEKINKLRQQQTTSL